ncbi:MAG: hypothetical protein S4CHLAM6_13980 [Chlamydiae bacterium]|nr:hypothetical protein [Chlamydiota bacterium]
MTYLSRTKSNPSSCISIFKHDLDIKYSEGTKPTTLLCCHGFGGNSQTVIDRVRSATRDCLISFNSIDHGFSHETGDDNKTMMATHLEVMPLLYVLKKSLSEKRLSRISLYGHALGGANIIQALSILNTNEQDPLLEKYGIGADDKIKMLEAIKKGWVVLDVPFKSIEEIIDLRGPSETLLMYQKRAAENNIQSPIETLKKLKGLNLNILVFFDTNNEQMSNRDDSLFFKNIVDANSLGTNILISSDNGGHDAPHPSLWKFYAQL